MTIEISVKVASTTNVDLSTPVESIDDVAMSAMVLCDDRINYLVLLAQQTNPIENGIYHMDCITGYLRRAKCMPEGKSARNYNIQVREGKVNGGKTFICINSPITDTVGQDHLVFISVTGNLPKSSIVQSSNVPTYTSISEDIKPL